MLEIMKLKFLLINILGANLVYIHSGMKPELSANPQKAKVQKECSYKTTDQGTGRPEKATTCCFKKP